MDDVIIYTDESADTGNIFFERGQVVQDGSASDAIEAAVYAHIRALRALGKASANTADIALALNLPVSIVHQAAENLKSKGVRLAG